MITEITSTNYYIQIKEPELQELTLHLRERIKFSNQIRNPGRTQP